MNELRGILEDSVTRLFADRLDREALTRIEQTGFPADLWAEVTAQGIDRVLAAEDAGGMDGGWLDACAVTRACGRYAVPLPVPEAILAQWLARQAGCTLPDGVPGLLPAPLDASALAGGQLALDGATVPWGRHADFFVGIAGADGGAELVVAAAGSADVEAAENLAGDPRDQVSAGGLEISFRGPVNAPADAVRWLGALARSAQIAGAGAAALEMAVHYAGEREQFGRPIGKFQAIQHHLADLAGTMASVDAITLAAHDALDRAGFDGHARDARFEIAAAKCRASEAVEKLTRLAHQVHGAIGFTYEYDLHFLTRRLWSWRAEFGGAGEWAGHLGRAACDAGGEGTWALITG